MYPFAPISLPAPNFQTGAPSPLTPGSDTSTLFDFELDDPCKSSEAAVKAAELASPTETLSEHLEPSNGRGGSNRKSRRLSYLERIEKVLASELNPFDLLASSDSDHSTIEAPKGSSLAAGAHCNDAALNKSVKMQNSGSAGAQHQLNSSAQQHEPRSNSAYSGAFYDPSSADGYSAPTQTTFLSAAPALSSSTLSQSSPAGSTSDVNLGTPNAFRDNNVNPSPLSSPYLGAISPANSHHRVGSHSSEASSPPQLRQGLVSDPSLSHTVGQMGQIRLDEDQRYLPTFDDSSDYAGSPGPGSQLPEGQSAAPTFSSMNSQPMGGRAVGSTPQLTLGIPTVSVSGSSMDFTPTAATVDTAMPSINVMAPSPSTPMALGGNGQSGGFQDILAQLAASQATTSGISAPVSQASASASWLSSDQSMTMHNEPFSYAETPGSTAEAQLATGPQQPLKAEQPFRPHSASGRLVPEGYTAESAQMMSTLAGNPQRNPAVHAPGQWSSQAKRQDSYDKIRQFLRLDVDMGFQSTGKTESPTLAMFRKRANSDVGPRSPVVGGDVPGAGTAFDWSLAATNAHNAKTGDALDLDWANFKGDSTVFPDTSSQLGSTQPATMDPALLSNPQMAADLSQAFDPSNAALLANWQQQQALLQHQQQQHQQHQQQQQQQQQQQHQQQQQQMQQIMAPMFQLNGQNNNILGGVDFASQLAGSASGEFNPQWRFPGDGLQQTNFAGDALAPTKLRRSSSARQSSSGGHRRLTHSEDLSRSRMYQGADEDFLSKITAPDGGLAPPSTGRSVSSNNAGPSNHQTSSPRVHPYRTGHDRHFSFGSNTSNSSTGSASPLPHFRGTVGYDAAGNLVQYSSDMFGGMGGEDGAQSPSASSAASGTSSLVAPPVPVVTSQATQAASASRRKSEALFACPIPGCGSTFTRQYNLRGHLRSHADERPYKCDWPGCDKSFARSHDCKRHQNLHLNIKPHTCEQCGKTFARLDALNRHHKSDTGGCTMRSDGESQSNETDGSSISGPNDAAGSDSGSGRWQANNAGATTATASSSKTFGGHVL